MENNQEVKYESLANGIGITGLVLGILTLLISFIPCFGAFAFYSGIIAVIVTLVGLVIALKHKHKKKGILIAGLVTSLLGCGIAYSQFAALAKLGTEAKKDLEKEISKEVQKIQEVKKTYTPPVKKEEPKKQAKNNFDKIPDRLLSEAKRDLQSFFDRKPNVYSREYEIKSIKREDETLFGDRKR